VKAYTARKFFTLIYPASGSEDGTVHNGQESVHVETEGFFQQRKL